MGLRHLVNQLFLIHRLFTLARKTTLFFGTEAPLDATNDPDLWHHLGLTIRGSAAWGASRDGQPRGSRAAIAWHADYLDSYAYNPEWWLNPVRDGGPDRLAVALSTHDELVKLHFDDLFALNQLESAMRRYLSGTVCGLLWLAQAGLPRARRVACGQNLIGASLHALQDFYSHSSWVDRPERRDLTWFDFPLHVGHRDVAFVYTGSYELEPQLGLHPHGTVEYFCALLRNLGIAQDVLDVLCAGVSPFTKSSLCDNHRRCASAQPVNLTIEGHVRLPDGIAWIDPGGMNLDSYWQSPTGRRTRGIRDLSSREVFETAYRLAARSTCQWLAMLEQICDEAEIGWLLDELRSTSSTKKFRTEPWERFDLLPYQFLTAGSYPLAGNREENETWFLRLLVETGQASSGNTNAVIEADVDSGRVALQHGPGRNAGLKEILTHNDLTAGSTAAYMVGPFTELPTELVLHNTAPSLLDVVVRTLEEVVDAIGAVLGAIAGLVKAIIGWDPECVGSANAVVPPQVLMALDPGGTPHEGTLRVDGGDEGEYTLTYAVEALRARPRTLPSGHAGFAFRVTFETLTCVRESTSDGLSTRDEVFVVGLVVGHGSGQPGVSWRSRRISGNEAVNTGSVRQLRKHVDVWVPLYGAITVPVAIWESDHETGGDRDEIQRAFAQGAARGAESKEPSLISEIGASIGQGWQAAAISGVAFRRGEVAEVVGLQRVALDRWLDGGESLRIPLAVSGPAASVAVPDQIAAHHLECTTFEVPHPPVIEEVENPDHDPNGMPYSPKHFRPEG